MTAVELILWQKIEDFQLDDHSASFKFSKRLARENGWSMNYTLRVIQEYKKFIFLCCISETGVTPSDPVDQVWHLHLTYTKSYWIDFCKNTLGKEIHHNPTKGGDSEATKFDSFYTFSRTLYKDKFSSEPPLDIWQNNEKRFSDINFRRINLRKYWLVPKPKVSKNLIIVYAIVVIGFLFIQASDTDSLSILFGILIGIPLIVSIIKALRNKNSGNDGCTPSGCGSGCTTHSSTSGCGSGCSGCSGSGCSGCGGGGD